MGGFLSIIRLILFEIFQLYKPVFIETLLNYRLKNGSHYR
jgi:hypothetical protein